MTEVTKRRILDMFNSEYSTVFTACRVLLRSRLMLGCGQELLLAALPLAASFASLYLPLTKRLPFCDGSPLFASLPMQLLPPTSGRSVEITVRSYSSH